MSENQNQPILPYESAPAAPTRQSPWAIASIVTALVAAVWNIVSVLDGRALPFDVSKQNRIGTTASVLAVIFAVAAYRQAFRRRGLAHVAITLAGLSFAFAELIVPL
jgi:hypothetical protein